MKRAQSSSFTAGPEATFNVGKKPFVLILRYLRTGYGLWPYRSPVLSPFGLSLSKPLSCGTKAPFDRLRANGMEKPSRSAAEPLT
jgi:hypothetical protein